MERWSVPPPTYLVVLESNCLWDDDDDDADEDNCVDSSCSLKSHWEEWIVWCEYAQVFSYLSHLKLDLSFD